MWLYPPDENGNSLMARPATSEEDYRALKKGILRNLFERRSKAGRKEFRQKLDAEVIVSDEILQSYVDYIIRKDLRQSSYDLLKRAKNSKKAVIAYYNFVNAYRLLESGEESYGNICCMAIDRANELLRSKNK